ncbi:MAG: ArsR/SmtB family transcription factor [Solirubrobacteraceae bacterium]
MTISSCMGRTLPPQSFGGRQTVGPVAFRAAHGANRPLTPADPDIGPVAAAMGQPTRATMLTTLLGGAPVTVTELGCAAGVSASTASVHLARLASQHLVASEVVGRERHYRLAGPAVAEALEALQRIAAPPAVRSLSGAGAAERLRLARSCYDHLAGRSASR